MVADGQYYAARTGSEDQSPTGRRVLFSATGWHNPPGMGGCHTQIHLIPRDMALVSLSKLFFLSCIGLKTVWLFGRTPRGG